MVIGTLTPDENSEDKLLVTFLQSCDRSIISVPRIRIRLLHPSKNAKGIHFVNHEWTNFLDMSIYNHSNSIETDHSLASTKESELTVRLASRILLQYPNNEHKGFRWIYR
ncbi:hypothetical protein RclHR1_19370001 [Rhizophagus clarus]|uniref:Uncharacterized protein n=1 Tax=Rhizophagus clarus TaxID=94130 RepID=A0A2Z6QPB2_9GLOM|nr:hypothetical protein RclHR1_19370001 [Rhizophagus clarus]GES91283.1 hypothetical protein RCL_e6769_RclHR1_19370001 [Rhizophagus clarus]